MLVKTVNAQKSPLAKPRLVSGVVTSPPKSHEMGYSLSNNVFLKVNETGLLTSTSLFHSLLVVMKLSHFKKRTR